MSDEALEALARVDELEKVNEALAGQLDETAYYLAQTRFAIESLFYVMSGGQQLPWEAMGLQDSAPKAPPAAFVPRNDANPLGNRAKRRQDLREMIRERNARERQARGDG